MITRLGVLQYLLSTLCILFKGSTYYVYLKKRPYKVSFVHSLDLTWVRFSRYRKVIRRLEIISMWLRRWSLSLRSIVQIHLSNIFCLRCNLATQYLFNFALGWVIEERIPKHIIMFCIGMSLCSLNPIYWLKNYKRDTLSPCWSTFASFGMATKIFESSFSRHLCFLPTSNLLEI